MSLTLLPCPPHIHFLPKYPRQNVSCPFLKKRHLYFAAHLALILAKNVAIFWSILLPIIIPKIRKVPEIGQKCSGYFRRKLSKDPFHAYLVCPYLN